MSGARRIIGASRRICMSRIRDLFGIFDVSLQKKNGRVVYEGFGKALQKAAL
jgi:hypothetical protein